MSDRRRHGADEDRIPAPMEPQARRALARPADCNATALGGLCLESRAAHEPAQSRAAARRDRAAADRHRAPALVAALAFAPFFPRPPRECAAGRRCGAVRRHVHELFRAGERVRRAAGAACGWLPRRRRNAATGGRFDATAVLRPHLSRLRPRRSGAARSDAGRRGARARRCTGRERCRPRAIVPAVDARRIPGARARRRDAAACGQRPVDRGVPRARARSRQAAAAARAAAAAARTGPWPLPSESVRCGGNGPALDPGARCRADCVELLRNGGLVRLWRRTLRRVDAHGGTVIAARGAQCRRRHADRRRRHELPPSDRRRHARLGFPRGGACDPRARARTRRRGRRARMMARDERTRIAVETLAHYDRHAQAFWEGTRDHDVRQNLDALLARIDAHPPFTILDLGCGPGRDLRTLAELGHAAIGLEGAPRFVAMARQYSGCDVWQQDFLELDLPPERFDGIFANALLFHVPSAELPRVLGELRNALKAGAVLFASNPHGHNEEGWNRGRFGAYHDLAAWSRHLSEAGFALIDAYYRPAGLPRDQQPWLATVSR